MLFLIKFLEEAFIIRNIIILLFINYMIIICTDVNSAVINNYNVRLQDLIVLFKISIGTCKDFFELRRQFWACNLKILPALRSAICLAPSPSTSFMFLQSYWLASYSLRTSHCLHQSLYNCEPKSSWYSLPAWPLNLGVVGCPQTLADNYQSTPCNSPEGQRS
jgi:hypothetical protein